MAEEKIEIDGDAVVDTEKSKVDELDRSRDSDEGSGGSSEGEDNGQRRGTGSDSDHKQKNKRGRRRRGLKRGKKHNRNRTHPYAATSCPDRVEKKKSASSEWPHAPRNTTQYLIEDHVKSNISPDLSNRTSPASVSEETTETKSCLTIPSLHPEVLEDDDETADGRPHQDSPHLPTPLTESERLEFDQEFVAVYDDVNEDRLNSMTKAELVRITSRLLQRVEREARKAQSGVGVYAMAGAERGKEETTGGLRDNSPNTTPLSSCN